MLFNISKRWEKMDSKNLKLKAYNYIKKKIISGVYAPNQKLEESEISSELNFSRTPIREAINTLKDEGWITIIARKGIFVSEISLKDINDIFKVRENIEPVILRLAFENIDIKELDDFQKSFEKYYKSEELNSIILDEEDNNFHNFILSSSKNKFLINMMTNVYEHNQRLRNISKQKLEKRKDAIHEHLEIIKAIKEKNMEKAIETLSFHIVESRNNFLSCIGNLNL